MKMRLVLTAVLVFGLRVWPAEAAIFVDTVSFFPQGVVDTHSGNGIDFVYEHDLSEIMGSGLKLISAELALTHLGNADEGPTREIWLAFTGEGRLIGRLSKSEPNQTVDHWGLESVVLGEITKTNPWGLKIGLSEQTSFNNERMDLYQSQLKVDYEKVPGAPEPALIFMLALGLAAYTATGALMGG